MNTFLNYDGFEDYLIGGVGIYRHGGVQYLFKFENGYGASVIKDEVSYGHNHDLWELAVIKFDNECDSDFNLCYETPITDYVEGCLTDKEVRSLLRRIKEL